jgi:hypothetical protein
MKTTLLALTTILLLASCGKRVETITNTIVEELPDTRLSCKVFDIAGVVGIPKFSVLESIGTIKTSQLDSPSSNNSLPLSPLIDSEFESMVENVGLDCNGEFIAEVSGIHQLIINSDDGSTVSIDGVKLIDNNGSHAMVRKSVSIMLLKGKYKLNVTYYNGSGLKGLILSTKRPNRSKEEIATF